MAISSDDVFALEKEPGKTLCIGASYIRLECAGFLAGLGFDTTVAVRSILLRGFDRECTEKIDENMTSHGVKFKRSVTVSEMKKTKAGQIEVVFSDGSTDVGVRLERIKSKSIIMNSFLWNCRSRQAEGAILLSQK